MTFKTTVQEVKGKFTTPVPTSLVKIIGINKGDKLNWLIEDSKIKIEVKK